MTITESGDLEGADLSIKPSYRPFGQAGIKQSKIFRETRKARILPLLRGKYLIIWILGAFKGIEIIAAGTDSEVDSSYESRPRPRGFSLTMEEIEAVITADRERLTGNRDLPLQVSLVTSTQNCYAILLAHQR